MKEAMQRLENKVYSFLLAYEAVRNTHETAICLYIFIAVFSAYSCSFLCTTDSNG